MTTDWHLTEFQFHLWDLYQSKKIINKKKKNRSTPPNCTPKMHSKPTGGHPCQSMISFKANLQLCWDHIPTHRCLPCRFLHTSRTTPLDGCYQKKKMTLKAKDILKQIWVTETTCSWNFINLHIHLCCLCQYHIGNTFLQCIDCLVLQYPVFSQLRSPESEENK